MPPEEELILFAVLQDIADELRKIKLERQEAVKWTHKPVSIMTHKFQ
jgi:hypothetical protein